MKTLRFIDDFSTITPEQQEAIESLVAAPEIRRLSEVDRMIQKVKPRRRRGWATHISWKRLAPFQWSLGKQAQNNREIDERIQAFKDAVHTLRADRGKMHLSEDGLTLSVFIGTVTALDPCGCYHPFYEEAPAECVKYWDAIREAAEEAGMWIEHGEFDPIDVFLCCDGDNIVEVDE